MAVPKRKCRGRAKTRFEATFGKASRPSQNSVKTEGNAGVTKRVQPLRSLPVSRGTDGRESARRLRQSENSRITPFTKRKRHVQVLRHVVAATVIIGSHGLRAAAMHLIDMADAGTTCWILRRMPIEATATGHVTWRSKPC